MIKGEREKMKLSRSVIGVLALKLMFPVMAVQLFFFNFLLFYKGVHSLSSSHAFSRTHQQTNVISYWKNVEDLFDCNLDIL